MSGDRAMSKSGYTGPMTIKKDGGQSRDLARSVTMLLARNPRMTNREAARIARTMLKGVKRGK